MLRKTDYIVDLDLIESVANDVFSLGKHTLTEPTGDFFYDPWKIKKEYNGTVWENIMCQLDVPWGEARLIVMESPSCYTQHADIDDRYHLNISGDIDFLVDTESKTMYSVIKDGVWYEMDAGILHSAVTIGEHKRAQLVVRKLLNRNSLKNPIGISIQATGNNFRYHFDNFISPWLNRANKQGIINKFKSDNNTVTFEIEKSELSNLKENIPNNFIFEIVN